MELPANFDDQPITQANVDLLHAYLDHDEEFCPEFQVWIDLCNQEGMEPVMGSVVAWIAPPP